MAWLAPIARVRRFGHMLSRILRLDMHQSITVRLVMWRCVVVETNYVGCTCGRVFYDDGWVGRFDVHVHGQDGGPNKIDPAEWIRGRQG